MNSSVYYANTEEDIIAHHIASFRCLTDAQIVRLIDYKRPEVVEKIIYNLKKRQNLFEKKEHFLTVNPADEPNPKIIDAYWVCLLFVSAKKIDHTQICTDSYPIQALIMTNNATYSVISVTNNEGNIVRKCCKEYVRDETGDKVIFAVRDEKTYRELSKRVISDFPQYATDSSVTFAIINYPGSDSLEPKVVLRPVYNH